LIVRWVASGPKIYRRHNAIQIKILFLRWSFFLLNHIAFVGERPLLVDGLFVCVMAGEIVHQRLERTSLLGVAPSASIYSGGMERQMQWFHEVLPILMLC
jgi:hypothetical protein